MNKGLVAMVLVAAIACTTARSAAVARPSPSPPVGAAQFRADLDALMAARTLLIAKATMAAMAGQTDEFKGYAAQLASDESDIRVSVQPALGAAASSEFARDWAAGDAVLIGYAIGLATHNQSNSDAALATAAAAFITPLTTLLAQQEGLSVDAVKAALTDGLAGMKAVVDDIAAGDRAKTIKDLATAYAAAPGLADLMAAAAAKRNPTRFPGLLTGDAADLRAAVALALQENSSLVTMAGRDILAGAPADHDATAAAVAASNIHVAQLIAKPLGADTGALQAIFAERDAQLGDYATAELGGDAAGKQKAQAFLGHDHPVALTAWFRTRLGSTSIDDGQAIALALQCLDAEVGHSYDAAAEADYRAGLQSAATGQRIAEEISSPPKPKR